MVRKAYKEDIKRLAELFDQYRIFYHQQSDMEGAEEFLDARIENNDAEIFVFEEIDVAYTIHEPR